jgi:transcriptional regulator with XRE-family HTH domain
MNAFLNAREAEGLTVSELAASAGVTPDAVHLVEDGRIGLVRLHLILNICDALGLTQAQRYTMIADAHADHRRRVFVGAAMAATEAATSRDEDIA